MKIHAEQITHMQEATQAQALEDNSPAAEQLKQHFGDHTFFLNSDGLHIIEPQSEQEDGEERLQPVRLAHWKDETRTVLVPQDPEILDPIGPTDSND